MKLLLITPPMTQVNTPYPATAFLTGFLRKHGYQVSQWDASLAIFLALFSVEGLEQIYAFLFERFSDENGHWFLNIYERYLETIEGVVRFLQGKDPTLATRIANRRWLPEGPRFSVLEEEQLNWAFGSVGIQDRAKFIASLYIDDLVDVIREIDPLFGLSRYADKLAESQYCFSPLKNILEGDLGLIDAFIEEHTEVLIAHFKPEVVLFTIPFPGNVYGCLRMASWIQKEHPNMPIIAGGGYVNTELRFLTDPRFFDYVDYLVFDDGEGPLLRLLDYLAGNKAKTDLMRTKIRENNVVVYYHDASAKEIPFSETGTPTYDGLVLDSYLSLLELPNPMHRMWSDGRWNKVMLAHGCYWGKCAFCDVSLDYISRYDPAGAEVVVDRMLALIEETGNSGFHFVDEAAPPQRLRQLSQQLLARGITTSWWGNIRFERTFTPALAQLMADAGCVAVTGGLEVASDRLLKLMQKGVNIEQVAKVTHAFAESGIMVHAYLMYGFPTQTIQETVDSLEIVRQLFVEGCIQSCFWHRLSVTIHNSIAQDPAKFRVKTEDPRLKSSSEAIFAINDLVFREDPVLHDKNDLLGEGLKKAVYNYMHGIELDMEVHHWFSIDVPTTTHSPTRIHDILYNM